MVRARHGHVVGSEPHEGLMVARWHCLPCSFMPNKKGELVAQNVCGTELRTLERTLGLGSGELGSVYMGSLAFLGF